MKLIDKDLVEETWQEVSQYPVEKMADEQARFIKVQPSVAPFIMAFTEEYGEEISSLALYMAYVVYRMFEKSVRVEIPSLSRKAIESAFQDNEEWLKGIQKMDERLLQRRLENSDDVRQLFVIKYVIEAIFEEGGGGNGYQDFLNDDTRNTIFMVIKIFIDALDGVTEV